MTWDKKSIEILENKIKSGISLKSILREMSIECILENKESPSFPFYIERNDYIDTDLRASNIKYNYSEEEIKNIYLYKNNPVELLKILSGPEIITTYEKGILKIYQSNRFNLYFTPHRNVGTTHTIFLCAMHYIFNNSEKSVLLYTPDDKSLKRLLNIYKEIPFYAKPGIKSLTHGSKYLNIIFDNHTQILATTSFGSVSKQFDYLLIDDIYRFEENIFYYFFPMASSKSESRIMAYCSDKKRFDEINIPILTKNDLSLLSLEKYRDDKLNKLI
jgi:hypothetical protein